MSRLTQGGQFMTEKEGGSDVGTLTTRAVQEGDHWRLHGEKWFCSNADAKVVMLLARPEGAGPGTRHETAFSFQWVGRKKPCPSSPRRERPALFDHPPRAPESAAGAGAGKD